MKKIYFILTAILIITVQSFSQWSQQPPVSISYQFNIVQFLNWQIGYIGAQGCQILKTTNYGQNWYPESVPTSMDVRYLHFFDFNTGYALCGDNTSNTSKILRTTNGGFAWNQVYSGSRLVLTKGIYFINSTTGYVSCNSQDDSAIVKTTNNGWNWVKIRTGNIRGINKFCFLDTNTGYAAGYGTDGRQCIIKTTDSGINWLKIYVHPTALQYMSVYFVNVNTGWVIGAGADNHSLIQKTTDSGLNWTEQVNHHPANSKLNEIQMLNENTGWIVGDASQIIKTTNGGFNWRAQTNPAGTFTTIQFRGADTGYVAGYIGNDGLLLKTLNGGGPVSVQHISEEVPSAYSLSQNYPNPFNPVTKIKFSIPLWREEGGRAVLLKVYDVIGREIQTLVNESLQPGTYETSLDGSKLNSGVYFYSLITDKFKETKKMILIK